MSILCINTCLAYILATHKSTTFPKKQRCPQSKATKELQRKAEEKTTSSPRNHISSQSTFHSKAVGPSVRGFMLCIVVPGQFSRHPRSPPVKSHLAFQSPNNLERYRSIRCILGVRSDEPLRRDGRACPSSSSGGET